MKIFLILFCFVATRAFCQDYVVVGDTLKQGKVRRSGDKIMLGYGSTLVEYPMSQVTEYRQGSSVHQSLGVGGDRKMYKRVADGKISLYKRRKHYLLRSTDSLVELHKRGFRSTLAKSLSCTGKGGSMFKVTYTRPSLQRTVEASNAGSCNLDRMPYRQFGFMLAYSFTDLRASSLQTIHSNVRVNVLASNLFFEAPLFARFPWLYGSTELLFQTGYKAEFVFQEPKQDTQMTTSMLSIMLMPGLKAMAYGGRIKPYFRLAPAIAETFFESKTGLRVKGSLRDGQLVSNVPPDEYLQLGFSTAVGMQWEYSQKLNFHLELRYLSTASNPNTQFEISSKSAVILFGLSL